MMDVANDGSPFTQVSSQKMSKKPCTDESEHAPATHEFETPIQILFLQMPKAGTDFNMLANVKQVLLTMMKADSTLSVLSLNKKLTYCPSHDAFPTSKENCRVYFLVHPTSTKAANQQTVAAGCILCSSNWSKISCLTKLTPLLSSIGSV